MLVCKDCKTPIEVKTNMQVLSGFFVTKRGIRLSELTIVKPKEVKYTFYCATCNKDVVVEDLVAKCYLCSKYTDVKDTVMLEERGVYCTKCASDVFQKETMMPLSKALEGKFINE